MPWNKTKSALNYSEIQSSTYNLCMLRKCFKQIYNLIEYKYDVMSMRIKLNFHQK